MTLSEQIEAEQRYLRWRTHRSGLDCEMRISSQGVALTLKDPRGQTLASTAPTVTETYDGFRALVDSAFAMAEQKGSIR